MQCKICNKPSERVFMGKILKKYDVDYYRCPNCDFLRTEEPYWLNEAYSSAICDFDLGPVNRAVSGSRIIEALIAVAFDPNAKFIDWGGGYGVLTRLMRDRGYDFYWRDLHCENLFAKQFIASDRENYELMTSFEVFEHLVEPMQEIAAMLKFSRNILFTTELPPTSIKNATQWWYFSPETGQHVSFYSIRALRFISKTFNLNYTTDGSSLHLLSEKPVSERIFKAIARDRWVARAIRKLGRRKLRSGSLLMHDFRTVTGWKI
jgi:hypothetical protein